MDRITPDHMRELTEAATPPCVSIYMPTHAKGRDTQGDPVRLKNLLKSAEEQLVERGMRGTIARDLLKPAADLMDDHDFWLHSSDALAVFIADGFFRAYRLPVQVAEMAIANDRFHVKALLPLMNEEVFHILALSMNDVRVLECSRHRIDRIALPEDVAKSFDDAIGAKDHHVDRGIWRNSAVGGPGLNTQAHGHGPDQDNEMLEDIAFFMRQLDEGVTRVIGEKTPLIVAGADSTAPHYLHVTKRKNVIPEFIHGNPEHVADETLRDKGLQILEPIWHKELNQAQERFGTALAQGIASNDIREILSRTAAGRVDTLFVAPTASVKGEYDAEHNMAVISDNGPDDLIDLAVHRALMTSARVVVTDAESVPGNQEAAAIYRY